MATPRRQRAVVLATVFVLHAALLVMFLKRSNEVVPRVKPTMIAMVALDAEHPAAAKPPPPVVPSKAAKTFKPEVEFSIPTEVASEAVIGVPGACSTEAAVLDALLLDQTVLDAVRGSPAELRSVAGAIVIWNEGWNPVALDVYSPLTTVRTNVERTLASVEPSCLDQPVVGPRLLPVPDASGTTTIFIVIGSGSWTWRALLAPNLLVAPPRVVSPDKGL